MLCGQLQVRGTLCKPAYEWLFLEFCILLVVLCAESAALVSWTVWAAIHYASLPPIFDDPDEQREFENSQLSLWEFLTFEERRRRGD
jgi:hypothetical protein